MKFSTPIVLPILAARLNWFLIFSMPGTTLSPTTATMVWVPFSSTCLPGVEPFSSAIGACLSMSFSVNWSDDTGTACRMISFTTFIDADSGAGAGTTGAGASATASEVVAGDCDSGALPGPAFIAASA
jgi:hypothetical protein